MKKIYLVFWVLWGMSLLLGFTEAVIYSGFVLNFIKIDISKISLIVGLLAFVILLFKLTKKTFLPVRFEKVISIVGALTIVLFVILKIVNRLAYPTFIFNTVHIQPDALKWAALIAALSIVVVWTPQIKFKKLLNIQSGILAFVLLIIGFNLYQIYKSEWQDFQYIIANPKATYDDKMGYKLCPIFYDYTLFINRYTPEDSTLLMPPQSFPWPYVGNGGMLRYFVYPRNIINGEEYVSPSTEELKNIDYVLLNWGETEETQGGYTHEWRKFDVEAEKIIFMNEDGSFGGEVKGDYHYNDYKGKKVWGLIVVKH